MIISASLHEKKDEHSHKEKNVSDNYITALLINVQEPDTRCRAVM